MTWVIAHRGASAYEIENSMAAFRTALEMGADGVELDVHTTVDGIAVVHHDPVVGDRCIADIPFEQLRDHKLSNGESIPTLADVLSVLGTNCRTFVEIKQLPQKHDRALLDVLQSGPVSENYHLHSFDHRIVRRLKRLCPALACGVLSTSYPVNPFAQLEDAGATELWQVHAQIDDQLITGAHELGYRVYAWTVDEPEEMRRLVTLNVDAICSNKPDVARVVVG